MTGELQWNKSSEDLPEINQNPDNYDELMGLSDKVIVCMADNESFFFGYYSHKLENWRIPGYNGNFVPKYWAVFNRPEFGN